MNCEVGTDFGDNLADMLRRTHGMQNGEDDPVNGPNTNSNRFNHHIEDGKQPLYLGCTNFLRLSFVLRLYSLKCGHGIMEAAFRDLLGLLREAFPHAHIPLSFNSTKNIIKDIGLNYQKIHACPNDCMLYWGENKDASACKTCGVSRWEIVEKKGIRENDPEKDEKMMANFDILLMPRPGRRWMQVRYGPLVIFPDMRCSPVGAPRNICDNILGTLLNIGDKSKDHLNARLDLQEMGIRKVLHLVRSEDGKCLEIRAVIFDMTKEEKGIFCSVLEKAKLPYGCAANISRYIHTKERTISGEHRVLIDGAAMSQRYNRERTHTGDFWKWLKEEAGKREYISLEVKVLAMGPNQAAKRFSGYVINGYIFYSKYIDSKCTTHNSGVFLSSLTTSFATSKDQNPQIGVVDYYGSIEEILEISYWGEFSTVLFKCCWYHTEKDLYGMTRVNFNRLIQKSDPYVMVSQVQQVFYIEDPTNKMFYNVINRFPRDWCDVECENTNEEDETDSIFLDIQHGSRTADEFGDICWMEEQCYNLRFFYLGKFQNSEYAGGKDGLIAGVEPDRFSCTVLMEHVKDDFKYSENGGIYIKRDEAGGWKMVTSDKDLPLLDKDMDFYIDNVVDPKMSYYSKCSHMPSDKNLDKFANVRRKLNLQNRQGEDKKIDEDETMDENDIQDASLPPPPPLPSPIKPMTVYEYNKWFNILKNNEKMNELGLPKLATNMVARTQKNKEKETMQDPDEYIPDDWEQSDEDSSQVAAKEKTKKVKKSKTQSGRRPTTRSVANPVTTTEEVPTGNDTNAKQAGKSKIVEPAIQIQLPCIEGLGTMVDYFVLRERKQKEAAIDVATGSETTRAPETDFPVFKMMKKLKMPRQFINCTGLTDSLIVRKVQVAKRLRGKTRMDRVHTRPFEKRDAILMNSKKQPISDDDKAVSELSRFLGTLKRVVPMTFASWARVPQTLKETLWNYTKQRYILPEELKVWALKTIQHAWRGNKSRTKCAHYLAFATDEERLANKPIDIPAEDFKVLLKYWEDPEIQTRHEGSKFPTPNPSDACLQELTKKIRWDVVEEVKEKFNRKLSDEVSKVKKVQDNVSLVLQKLLEANPGLNIDMDQICGTISGDTGADGTPLIGGRST
ncbi:hypothetical protein AgCh_017982 [Apium graveolens]